MSTETKAKPERQGPPRMLTIDASKSVAPHRVKSLVKAMCLGPGDRVSVQIVGRESGPRYDRARHIAARQVGLVGGVVA